MDEKEYQEFVERMEQDPNFVPAWKVKSCFWSGLILLLLTIIISTVMTCKDLS